jgi:hypothetical protein
MTAKELILKMIENELKVQTIIDNMYEKEENDITIEQLQKLKQIVEGLDILFEDITDTYQP